MTPCGIPVRIENQCGGEIAVDLHTPWSSNKKVQHPGVEGVSESQIEELGDEFG